MNAKKFDERPDVLGKQVRDSREQVRGKGASHNEQLALADLRARRSMTQAQLADAVGTTQSAVSRLERQRDLLVSTLCDYVEATGGRLRLVAEYPDSELDVDLPALHRADPSVDRAFRVVWQNQSTRQFVHVGWLHASGALFTFSYTPDAELDQDFEPFAPFPDLRATYESLELFSFFADRVASAAHPGFDHAVAAFGLQRAEATPVELLVRSWGRSSHDTIQIVPEPIEHPDGTQSRLFLVSGVSHADAKSSGRITKLIGKMKPGQRLTLRDEPENAFNGQAIVIERDGQVVGWVPDYLLDEVHKARSRKATVDAVVEQANGADTPWHLRLLCRLEVGPTATAGSAADVDFKVGRAPEARS